MKTHPKQDWRVKREVLDGNDIAHVLRRMAGEILEHHPKLEELLLVGIHTRGVPLSERLADEIERMEGERPRLGTIDITLYRDDLSTIGPQPVVKSTQLPTVLAEHVVVLCDDVLYTGRTVRAALDELKDYGRPRAVRLAVLIDRGHRELPIQADFVGKTLPTARSESVEVSLTPVDDTDTARIVEQDAPGEEESS